MCLPIPIEAETLEAIRRHVESAFHHPREAGGVLFGKRGAEGARIVASRALRCEHAMGPGFVLSAKDEKRLAGLIASPASDPELAGLEAVGWYHSHISSPIFLSERDLEMYDRYFPEAFQTALVIRLSTEHTPRAAFFFHGGGPSEEFSIQAPASAACAPQPTAHAAPPSPVVCPRCAGRRIRRSHRGSSVERLAGLFGYYPFRCQECLSRSFIKVPSSRQHGSRKRQEERRRARLRTRREILLWSGGIVGFLLILLYLVRDTSPKSDQ